MKGRLLCLPCTVTAAYDIAKKATNDEELHKEIVLGTARFLAEDPDVLEETPAALHTYAFRRAQGITGNRDPFKHLKKVSSHHDVRST